VSITSGYLSLATLEGFPWGYYILGPIGAILALVMAKVFSGSVMKRSEGDDEMVRIAQAVREGAMAYLSRQYKVVAVVFVALLIFLAVLAVAELQPVWSIIGVPIAGTLSGLCGWFGMRMATNASARTTFACKQSLNEGLTVAFRSGAVMGLVVVGFALLDVSVWYLVLNATGAAGDLRALTTVMLSFGMGASTQALFARVGGGIYTKAADVGADLVGKVEAGIPEDDARNPATIADNVGDNVGDVAGMGADLYESYYGSILATMALGAAAAFTIPGIGSEESGPLAIRLATAPIALAGLGIIASVIGVFTVGAKEGAGFAKLLRSLHMGVWVASGLIIAGAVFLLLALFGSAADVNGPLAGITSWRGLLSSIVSGLLAGLVIANATEYYTSYEHAPTRRIAEQALTGPATVIISGIAEGMKSTWASLLTVVVAILLAFTFAGGSENFLMGLYGVGIAAVGMLSTLGITLATDAYGPIADNAGGNAEMTGQPPEVRERTDMLDSLGNTTAATGKGFAIGSAALTALALFAAFIQVVETQITRQSEAYVETLAGEAGEAPDGAEIWAVYEGHGRFAIVHEPVEADAAGGAPADGAGDAEADDGQGAPGERFVDGGMLTDRERLHPMQLDAYEPGDKFLAEPVPSPHELGGTTDDFDPREVRVLRLTRVVEESPVAGGTDEPIAGTPFEVVSSHNGSISDVLRFYDVSLANPKLLGGIFMGVLLAFLFCALTMNAVGRAAYAMMNEVRRQFGKMRDAFRAQGMPEEQIADPMQWPKRTEFEGKQYPDYATCVSISTAGAQREMVIPALLAILVPIGVGLVLSVPGVMGLLAGGLTSGFAVAVFMANSGGAWDNAKKLLESYGRITADEYLDDPSVRERLKEAHVSESVLNALQGRAQELRQTGQGDEYVYGKGSDDHKATVVGDTVGDPFKDTSGPSLNILIKLISIVSVVFAGLTVKYGPMIGAAIGLS